MKENGCNTSENRCAFPWQGMIIDLTGDVLPCPYYHLSTDGKNLGNTNVHSVEEIWNGPDYRDLRRRHRTGDLEGHPCGTCYITRLNDGIFPQFEWGTGFRHEAGLCYVVQVPERFWEKHKDRVDEMTVLENGIPMPARVILADDVRQEGAGRYCFWMGYLYLSTDDGSHPGTNGRSYCVAIDDEYAEITSLKLDSLSARNVIGSHEEYVEGRETLESAPGKIWFIETTDCNIDCPHCSQNEQRFVGAKHRASTGEEVRALIPQLQELIWHGGEPYMIPAFRDFVKSYERRDNPNLSFGFMSNGLMITDKELAHLERFERFNVTISVDSFVAETYEKMRHPAKFERLEQSLLRLVERQHYPDRKLTVAMIIGKTNFRDIAYNMSYARRHNIRMMINPIYQYPPTEKLNLFSDFEAETEGWESSLTAAEKLISEAHEADAQFLRQLDCGKQVAELRRLFEQAKVDYSDCHELVVRVCDAQNSVSSMRRPGLLVRNDDEGVYQAIAYRRLQPGERDVVIAVPRSRVRGRLNLEFFPDVHELGTFIGWPEYLSLEGPGPTVVGPLELPDYVTPPRLRNIGYAKRNRSSAVEIRENTQLMTAFKLLTDREKDAGFGFRPNNDPSTPNSRWRSFLNDFYRPYTGREGKGEQSKSRHL